MLSEKGHLIGGGGGENYENGYMQSLRNLDRCLEGKWCSRLQRRRFQVIYFEDTISRLMYIVSQRVQKN